MFFSIPGESFQSVRMACWGTRGGCHRAGPHRPASQRVRHLQLPVVLTGSLYATGLRHLTTVRAWKWSVWDEQRAFVNVCPTDRMKVCESVGRMCFHKCVWAGNSLCACLTVCSAVVWGSCDSDRWQCESPLLALWYFSLKWTDTNTLCYKTLRCHGNAHTHIHTSQKWWCTPFSGYVRMDVQCWEAWQFSRCIWIFKAPQKRQSPAVFLEYFKKYGILLLISWECSLVKYSWTSSSRPLGSKSKERRSSEGERQTRPQERKSDRWWAERRKGEVSCCSWIPLTSPSPPKHET